ncbi:uncharacterized protein LOC134768914 [Penaeus indicus]|uniref:uncharacterized protein LOC134768914 n=1 Tax=Penaeus indicus TaxID=29960 RepID=UPI00300C80F2
MGQNMCCPKKGPPPPNHPGPFDHIDPGERIEVTQFSPVNGISRENAYSRTQVAVTTSHIDEGKADGNASMTPPHGGGGNPRYYPDPSRGGRPAYNSQQHGVDVIRSNSGQGAEEMNKTVSISTSVMASMHLKASSDLALYKSPTTNGLKRGVMVKEHNGITLHFFNDV